MSVPLISPDWSFALWAVLIAVAGFGFWADSTRIGKQVSGIGIMYDSFKPGLVHWPGLIATFAIQLWRTRNRYQQSYRTPSYRLSQTA